MGLLGDPAAEGVVTEVPGTTWRAYRYSSRAAVPLLLRWHAKQIGAAGYWYVPLDTPSSIWDKIGDETITVVDRIGNALGADRGVLGIFSTLLGIPYPLSVALVVFLAFALLRGAGLVPPLSGVLK